MHYFWASIWILVPVGFFVTRMATAWMRMKEKQIEVASRDAAEKAAQYAAGAERLEQRVRVLERIATDGAAERATKLATRIDEAAEHNAGLAGQIDALREVQVN